MKHMLVALLPICLVGCSSSILGRYECGDSIVKRFDFRSGDSVYVTILNMGEMPGSYKVDGDKIAITLSNMPGLVATRKGDLISGASGPFEFSCKKA